MRRYAYIISIVAHEVKHERIKTMTLIRWNQRIIPESLFGVELGVDAVFTVMPPSELETLDGSEEFVSVKPFANPGLSRQLRRDPTRRRVDMRNDIFGLYKFL